MAARVTPLLLPQPRPTATCSFPCPAEAPASERRCRLPPPDPYSAILRSSLAQRPATTTELPQYGFHTSLSLSRAWTSPASSYVPSTGLSPACSETMVTSGMSSMPRRTCGTVGAWQRWSDGGAHQNVLTQGRVVASPRWASARRCPTSRGGGRRPAERLSAQGRRARSAR